MTFEKWTGKESDFQAAAARYLDHLQVLWNHCPNGGMRDSNRQRAQKIGAQLKREGVKAGFPDVAIYEPRGKFFGLFIELKVEGKKPRPNQIKWLSDLKKRGYFVNHTDSLDEFIEIVDNYLKIK
jgi:hypothetical protein